MANLLPRERRKQIERERWIRMTAIAFILLLLVVVLSGISLTPSLILSRSKGEDTERQLAIVQGFIALQEGGGVAEEVRNTKVNLSMLSLERSEFVLTDLLNALSKNVTSGVIVEDIRFELTNNTSGSFTINGFAPTRSSLLSFVNSLESEGVFSEINLPVSNLARGNDIKFLFTAVANTPGP